MNENPYASPAIPADLSADLDRPREMKIVSQGKRFIHFLVDTIVIQVVAQIGGFAIGVIYAIAKLSVGGTITEADKSAAQILGSLWGLFAFVCYYLILEMLFQRTVAKLLTGSIVVNTDGRRATFKQILGRSFARLIPFEAFSFLASVPVGWHDSLSGTRVVSVR